MNPAFLNQPYNRNTYQNFVQNFLLDFAHEESTLKLSANSLFTSAQILGHGLDDELAIIEIHSDPNSAGGRIAITKEAFNIMRDHGVSNALIAFNTGQQEWRLSLLTTSLKLNEKGRVTSQASNPRRYSYLLGPSAKIKTPKQFLIDKGSVSNLGQLRQRFSVEVVNKEFYSAISSAYLTLIGKNGQGGQLKLPGYSTNIKTSQEFAVRLLGRIIFCWFLKKKTSPKGALIPESLLSLNAVDKHQDYYHDVLEPLFFETLNTEIDEREQQYKVEDWANVPYLNGGLFNPDEDIDYYEKDPDTNMSLHINTLKISNEWFIKLFKTLETYNFTIDENTIIDQELSIDPEMLGRIFENLLAEEINEETKETARNNTGSFYTPRQIVEYMVDESLIQYLTTKTGTRKDKLKALISYDENDDLEHPLEAGESDLIINALSKLKVLDPACGSGAFPMGMLHKVVYILDKLDPKADKWLEAKLSGLQDESFKERIRSDYKDKSLDYIRKSFIIKDSIFGVDIQPIAVEVAKLRCFLTLIIDEQIIDDEKNRGIDTLPNLDFKFVAANTLLKPPSKNSDGGLSLFDEFEIKLLRMVDRYYSAKGATKQRLWNQISELINKKVNENKDYVLHDTGIIRDERFIDTYRQKNSVSHTKLLKEANIWESYKNVIKHKTVEFFETGYFFPSVKDGFDIVIGNPPYIQLQKNGGVLADMYKDEGYETFARTGDIYSLFYERGLQLTKQITGLLCYITSNKWMRAGYGQKTRGFLAKHNPLKLVDLGGEVFDSATVDTNILLIENTANLNNTTALDISKEKNITSFDGFDDRWVTIKDLTPDTWTISSELEQSIKSKIEAKGTPLKDWDIQINYGIKTGYNDAFIIDSKKKDELIAQDPKSAEIIKPILRGRDIKRYKADFANLWLIGTFPALRVNIDEYPAIRDYLKTFGKKLNQTGEEYTDEDGNKVKSRKRTGNKWFETQDQISYHQEFEKRKIVWPMVSSGNSSFCIVGPGYLLNNKCFIITGTKLLHILGMLNSKLAWFYFKATESPLGDSFEIRTPGMLAFPAKKLTVTEQHQLEELVEKLLSVKKDGEDTSELESQINQLVYQLYDLTPEEIAIVEGSK